MSSDAKLLMFIEAYGKARSTFVEMYRELSILRDEAKANKFSEEDLVNLCITLRETSRFINDLRKEYDGVEYLLQQICCAIYTQKHINDAHEADPIRTGLVTGSPTMKMCAKVPKLKDNPEAYYSLMDHFKIPRDIAEMDVLRTHYPTLNTYLTELATEGKPLPEGIKPGDTYAVYSVILRTVFDLDEVISELDDIKAGCDDDPERNAKCKKYVREICSKRR